MPSPHTALLRRILRCASGPRSAAAVGVTAAAAAAAAPSLHAASPSQPSPFPLLLIPLAVSPRPAMAEGKKGNPLAVRGGGCPAGFGHSSSGPDSKTNCEEPPDREDRPIHPCMRPVENAEKSTDEGDEIPEEFIPATGRGNSSDGRKWLNPSANQLYRALNRKKKPIDKEDSPSVAHVHTLVTDQSWRQILEYEALHKDECPNPSLARFQGKDGIYSLKAKFLNFFGVPLPFDRHDWTVDRCGKEIVYIIDYYDWENEDGEIEYFIDARPDGLSGLIDRARLKLKEWWSAE